MSYANRKQMSSNRTAAIIIVALIHIALGYALVTGLAYNVLKKAAEDLKTFDVEDEPYFIELQDPAGAGILLTADYGAGVTSPVIGTQPIGKITVSGDDTVIDLPLA